MSAFAHLMAEDRRLAMLRFLEEEPGHSLNTSMLQTCLCAIGHQCSRDVVATAAAWLEEQGLIVCESVGPVQVCSLTERGADVARGLARVPGVKRPSPRG